MNEGKMGWIPHNSLLISWAFVLIYNISTGFEVDGAGHT